MIQLPLVVEQSYDYTQGKKVTFIVIYGHGAISML